MAVGMRPSRWFGWNLVVLPTPSGLVRPPPSVQTRSPPPVLRRATFRLHHPPQAIRGPRLRLRWSDGSDRLGSREPPCDLKARVDAELAEDAREVAFDGALGDEESGRELGIGGSTGHERRHLHLAP